ncbi:hypothetical protein Bca4012_030443 [Brassica carinata]
MQIVLKIIKWINLSTIHTCWDCLKEPKLTSNTKLDTTACLGAWYAWDQILQTSLEAVNGKLSVEEECPSTSAANGFDGGEKVKQGGTKGSRLTRRASTDLKCKFVQKRHSDEIV